MPEPRPNIGVLALQGAFREHVQALAKLGVTAREVRLPKHLAGLDGLIFPGGESTTIGKLMVAYDLDVALKDFAASGGAIWGTCAGAIILASDIEGSDQPRLGLMDISVARNAFGRQIDSFEALLPVKGLAEPFPAVFIRAPVFTRTGKNVDVLARVNDRAVLARQGRFLASSFHPELSNDPRLHDYFLNEVVGG
ncbi:MAG TPA: pyridoxal 5'-phosphate synthase glutaminase subunit PdxT [Deinococcales bacterium]|nr:pyridoxal 5'-phosphate synthase glutaminase subunit PdxT [Deinococcales bacterium]